MKTFKVYHTDYMGDEPMFIRAMNAEFAAEEYGERYDSNGDYPLSDGDVIEVVVEDPEGMKKRFKVNAESRISYYANELKEL